MEIISINEFLISFCVGVGLAAACGFRLFLPLLVAGIFIKMGWLVSVIAPFFPESHWLASPAALICFSVASLFEIAAYKIPFIDHFLDLLTTPTAFFIGSVLMSQFLVGIDNPVLKFGTAIIFGGGAAGLVQTSTAAARLLSTKTTGGLANPAFSFAEAFLSVVTSVMTFFIPLITLFLLIIFGWFIFKILKKRNAS